MQKEINLKYQPHSNKQKAFHDDRYKVTYRGCFCGTGSGKTLAGAYETLSWLFFNPGNVSYVFEPTFPMVKRIMIPTFESKWLLGYPLEKNPMIQNFNKSDYCLTLNTKDPNQSSFLWMGSLENPERAEGPNVDLIWVDEARLVRNFELSWQVIVRRLRGSTPGNETGALVTTTPPAPGPMEKPNAVYKTFEHPKFKDPEAKVYRWSIFDNIHLSKQYLEQMKRTHTGKLGARFLYGLFVEIGQGSFNFDSTVHVTDRFPAEFREVVYGVDFGWTNPSAIVAVGVDGDGRAWIIDEFYQSRVREEDFFREAKTFTEQHGEGDFICDRSDPRTISEMRRIGINAKADESKRDSGIRAIGGRFEDAGDGKPRIFIHPRCVNLISELQIYDETKKENDHAVDALRYALASLSGETEGEIEISFGRRPR